VAGYSVTYEIVDKATKQIDAINRRIAQTRAPIERMVRSAQRFIDVSGLNKIAQGFEWIARAAGSVLRSLLRIVPAMGAITGAASIAGMSRLVSTWADWGKTLRIDADRLGITTDKLQNLQTMARLTGASAEDLTEAIDALSRAAADAKVGDATMVARFSRAGIAWNDLNGKLRTGSDLLPEVFRWLDSLSNPMDRARESAALLGSEQSKLYLNYRQMGISREEYFALQNRAARLNEAELAALKRYTLAQASLGVTFDNLGKHIGAVLAERFTPLLRHFDEFVQRHTPDILRAVDDLARRFAAWLETIKWEDVEAFFTKFTAALTLISHNLDTIKTVAEVVAGVFVTKWAVGMVLAIGQVVTAFGPLMPIMAGLTAWYLFMQKGLPALFGDRPLPLARPPGPGGMGQSTPNTSRGGSGAGPHHGLEPSRPGGGGHGGGPRLPAAPTAGVTGLAATPFGALIARGEGAYNSVNRGAAGGYRAGTEDLANKTVSEVMADQAAQRYNAAGRYQIIATTLKSAVASMGLRGDEKFNQGLQDRIFGEYLAGAKRPAIADYISGRSNDLNAAALAAAQEWASVADPRTGQSYYAGVGNNRASITAAEMADALRRTREQTLARTAAGPRAPAPPGTGYKLLSPEDLMTPPAAPPLSVPSRLPPINGSVDVSIINRNPPPNQSVTATATGAARVAPLRVEHGSLETI
jgi:hypothetical protein